MDESRQECNTLPKLYRLHDRHIDTMSTKLQHLQAMFARRREMEHLHIERTQAVNKYYDHWGKVTTRFENWTAPEYYKQAEEKIQRNKEEKEKQKSLAERKEKLTKLLNEEKLQYETELKERQRSRKTRTPSTKTLEKINENLKEQQNLRRKLELEAKLFGKWRHGVDDENLVFESKSDNEVIAKLNWLDKQVEQQLEREKNEVAAKERDLRLQEEQNKAELLHKERQQIREQEIKEIRSLQEMHMEQLKQRQEESSLLKQQEQRLRDNLAELDKEMELLDGSHAALQQPVDFGGAYNLKRIKVFMRKRSEIFRNHIKLCISILERCSSNAERVEPLGILKEKLSKQLDSEMYQLTQIDAMYESEAKYNLQKCEELWQMQTAERCKELKEFLSCEHIARRQSLNDVLKKQNDLIDIRATHLNAIESTSEKLKQLIKEEEDSPRSPCNCSHQNSPRDAADDCKKSVTFSPRNCAYSPTVSENTPNSSRSLPELPLSHRSQSANVDGPRESRRGRGLYNRDDSSSSVLPHLTNTFNNLNLDVWENIQSPKPELDIVRLGGQRSLQVVTPDTAERPKFGRKRVAWT